MSIKNDKKALELIGKLKANQLGELSSNDAKIILISLGFQDVSKKASRGRYDCATSNTTFTINAPDSSIPEFRIFIPNKSNLIARSLHEFRKAVIGYLDACPTALNRLEQSYAEATTSPEREASSTSFSL